MLIAGHGRDSIHHLENGALTRLGDQTAILWDAETGQRLRDFKGHSDSVYCVALSPDGRQVLTQDSIRVILWDAETGGKLRQFEGHSAAPAWLALNSDGRLVLTGSHDGTVCIWDAEAARKSVHLYSFREGADWLAVTPEGYYDGSPGGRARLTYRIDGRLNVIPADEDLYRPGLLGRVLAGQNS